MLSEATYGMACQTAKISLIMLVVLLLGIYLPESWERKRYISTTCIVSNATRDTRSIEYLANGRTMQVELIYTFDTALSAEMYAWQYPVGSQFICYYVSAQPGAIVFRIPSSSMIPAEITIIVFVWSTFSVAMHHACAAIRRTRAPSPQQELLLMPRTAA